MDRRRLLAALVLTQPAVPAVLVALLVLMGQLVLQTLAVMVGQPGLEVRGVLVQAALVALQLQGEVLVVVVDDLVAVVGKTRKRGVMAAVVVAVVVTL